MSRAPPVRTTPRPLATPRSSAPSNIASRSAHLSRRRCVGRVKRRLHVPRRPAEKVAATKYEVAVPRRLHEAGRGPAPGHLGQVQWLMGRGATSISHRPYWPSGLTVWDRSTWLEAVRKVNQSWRRLAQGATRSEQLEAALREEWADKVRDARDRLDAEADAAWHAGEDERVRRHRAAVVEWEQLERERKEHLERERTAWAEEVSQARQRIAVRARSAVEPALGAFALSVGVAKSGRPAGHRWAAPLVAAVSAAASAVPSAITWARLALKDPAKSTTREKEPVDSGPAPRPTPEPEDPADLNVTKTWLRELGGGHTTQREWVPGDDGVDRFLDVLLDLPDSYIVVRDLLVARSLDVDVLLAGPTGVWLFEVKHWSGQITCSYGAWKRRSEYFAKGGRRVVEEKPIEAFDKQWIREEDAVNETLRRRLPPKVRVPELAGGIVFTHPDASLDIDSSCRSAYGTPGRWVDKIRGAASVDDFLLRDRLAVMDALFSRARRLEQRPDDEASDAVALAEKVHADLAARAAAYCDR